MNAKLVVWAFTHLHQSLVMRIQYQTAHQFTFLATLRSAGRALTDIGLTKEDVYRTRSKIVKFGRMMEWRVTTAIRPSCSSMAPSAYLEISPIVICTIIKLSTAHNVQPDTISMDFGSASHTSGKTARISTQKTDSASHALQAIIWPVLVIVLLETFRIVTFMTAIQMCVIHALGLTIWLPMELVSRGRCKIAWCMPITPTIVSCASQDIIWRAVDFAHLEAHPIADFTEKVQTTALRVSVVCTQWMVLVRWQQTTAWPSILGPLPARSATTDIT